MLRGVSQVQLSVRDIHLMASFYSGKLGLMRKTSPEGISSDYWQCFSAGKVELAFLTRPLHESALVANPCPNLAIVFSVADMEAAREVLTARGIALSDVRAVMPGVQVCEFLDPEGNLLMLEARD
jgi:predicted enzyme related to lactoylglutathione lyase